MSTAILNLFHLLPSTPLSILLLLLLPYCLLLGSSISIILSSVLSSSATKTNIQKFSCSRTNFLPILPSLLPLILVSTLLISNISTVSYPLMGHLIITPVSLKLYICFTAVGLGSIVLLQPRLKNFTKTTTDLINFATIFIYFTPIVLISNSLLSFVFLLELLTTQIFILVILWDTMTREQIAHISDRHHSHQLEYRIPFNALFFFFWTSFIVAISMFFLLNNLITKYTTTDLIWLENIVQFIILTGDISNLSTLIFLMGFFLITLMIKFALAPFFFWKPIFFSALNLPSLLFYTIFFYSTLLTWLIIFWFSLYTSLTSIIAVIIASFLSLGFLTTVILLSNSTSLRVFFAISSVFNTLLIWFTFTFTSSTIYVLL